MEPGAGYPNAMSDPSLILDCLLWSALNLGDERKLSLTALRFQIETGITQPRPGPADPMGSSRPGVAVRAVARRGTKADLLVDTGGTRGALGPAKAYLMGMVARIVTLGSTGRGAGT